MARKSEYKGDHQTYVNKLKSIMDKLGVDKKDFDYDYGRHGGWVRFTFEGDEFYLDHSVQKAEKNGIKLACGKDAFAQLIYTIEDIVRAHKRGVYPLRAFFAEMIALPEPKEIPPCFRLLNFTEIPESRDEVKRRFRELAKAVHPDVTGGVTTEAFKALKQAEQDALTYYEDGGDG